MADFQTQHAPDPVAADIIGSYLKGTTLPVPSSIEAWGKSPLEGVTPDPLLSGFDNNAQVDAILDSHKAVLEETTALGTFKLIDIGNAFAASSAAAEGTNGPPPISSQVLGEVLQATGNPIDYIIDDIRDLNYICDSLINPLKTTVENASSLSAGKGSKAVCSGIEKMCKEIQSVKETVLGGQKDKQPAAEGTAVKPEGAQSNVSQ